jgi:EAL domain-containing protein (putative c-di-GMP-specific phosphodiesterase class I)
MGIANRLPAGDHLANAGFNRGQRLAHAISHRQGFRNDPLRSGQFEGALLDNNDVVLQALGAARGLGVRVSMDDFGTGYSSLSYLQKFPFDKVKIDQSFIRNIEANPERRAIVRAITTLASALGMKTTAEGVETEAELDCVRAEGCNEVQGYFTGRPQSAVAAAALLVSSNPVPVIAAEGLAT